MTELMLALAIGLVVGMALGALGGGGSVLTVPALVYLLGQSAQSAATASLVIVGVTSVIGMITYARDHRVRWKSGAAFGAAGVGSSYLGTLANRVVPEPALLLSFSGLMIVIGTIMIINSRKPNDRPVTSSTPSADSSSLTPKIATQVIAAGLTVGFLTGFLGVGGGFLIVPALTLVLRLQMTTAIATSLLVISINSATALLARFNHPDLKWSVIVPVTITAVVASLAGKGIASRISSRTLSKGFAVLIIIVAGYMGLRAIELSFAPPAQ